MLKISSVLSFKLLNQGSTKQNTFDRIEAETYIPYSQVIGVRAQKPCYLWAIRGWLGECSKMVEAATGHLLPRNPHTLDYCHVQS